MCKKQAPKRDSNKRYENIKIIMKMIRCKVSCPWTMEMIHIRGDIIQEIIVSHFDANFGDIFDAPNKGHSPKLQRKST